MAVQIPQGPRDFKAGSDLLQYRAVKNTGAKTAAYAGAGDDVLGITQAGCFSGQSVAVAMRDGEGTFKVTVAGAVADGDKLWPTGAAGMLSNSGGTGPAAFLAMEAGSGSGSIIEARAIAVAAVDSNVISNGVSGGNDGALPVIFQLLGVTALAGTYPIAVLKRKMNIVNWWIISRDTNAANVKIQNGVTDASGVIPKGVTQDAYVQGLSIVAAQKTLAAGTVLNVVSSANATFDVFVECTPTA